MNILKTIAIFYMYFLLLRVPTYYKAIHKFTAHSVEIKCILTIFFVHCTAAWHHMTVRISSFIVHDSNIDHITFADKND